MEFLLFFVWLSAYSGTYQGRFVRIGPNALHVSLSIAPETSLVAADRWNHVAFRAVFSWEGFVWLPTNIVVIAITVDVIYISMQRGVGGVRKRASSQCKPRGTANSHPGSFQGSLPT